MTGRFEGSPEFPDSPGKGSPTQGEGFLESVSFPHRHYSLDRERWSTKTLETVTGYYTYDCVARLPLCTCASDLSDDCVTSCASLWHAHVGAELHASAATAAPWANDSLATTPKLRRRLADGGIGLRSWWDDLT